MVLIFDRLSTLPMVVIFDSTQAKSLIFDDITYTNGCDI